MKQDTRVTQEDIDSAEVRLKPVLGIKPTHYLAALYGLAALAALFAIFFLPGVRRYGRSVLFDVDPPGSAIYVDGVYSGYSPCSVFMKDGKRSVKVTRPGFAATEFAYESKGRAFATLFWPPKDEVSLRLDSPDPRSALAAGVKDFARWALAGTPSDAYQIPMVLSEAAVAATSGGVPLRAEGLASAGLSYTRHAQSLRDLSRAVAVSYSGSAALGPLTLGRLASSLSAELLADPATALQLAALAPEPAKRAIEASDWYKRAASEADLARTSVAAAKPMGVSTVAGVELVAFGPGAVKMEAAGKPSRTELGAFMLAVHEVTVAEFARFAAERPEWSAQSAAALAAAGRAEADYLEGQASSQPGEPVRYVSWAAAAAYCDWLSARAPAAYRFSLPTEAQWAYAASASGRLALAAMDGPAPVSSLERDAAGLRGMLGNVWEWCADTYAVSPGIGAAGREAFPAGDKVVRGASWANRPDTATLASRGPMEAATCSPYLGFRVALVPKE